MLVGGYAVIVVLTCFLVAMNVRTVMRQYHRDRNQIRFYSFLATLVASGAMIIGLSGAIVQKVIESQQYLLVEPKDAGIPKYHR